MIVEGGGIAVDGTQATKALRVRPCTSNQLCNRGCRCLFQPQPRSTLLQIVGSQYCCSLILLQQLMRLTFSPLRCGLMCLKLKWGVSEKFLSKNKSLLPKVPPSIRLFATLKITHRDQIRPIQDHYFISSHNIPLQYIQLLFPCWKMF